VPDATETLEGRVHDRQGRAAADVGDEADAAGVAFVERAVQPKLPSERGGEVGRIPPAAMYLAGGGGKRTPASA
jgi:hypothetical protein